MELDIDEIKQTLLYHGYEYKSTIGKGGFSSVFLCHCQRYNCDFAIKRAIKNAVTLEEYNTLVSLIHPNVIRLYDAFEEESVQYLVMEYCPFSSINQKGKLTYEQFVNYSKQILEAISYCHSLNIAHRDIKPENIFIDQNDNVRLADFGMAKHFDYCDKSDEKCGSILYFPPEMFQYKEICPFKADIWALGITFFYMATGDHPFKTAHTRDDLCKLITDAKLNFGRYEIDDRIRFLIVKMTLQNPEMRLSAERLLKLPMFNPISSEIVKKRRLSCALGNTQPIRRPTYYGGFAKGRERSRSLNLSQSLADLPSNEEEIRPPSPLVQLKSYKSVSQHSPIQYFHSTFHSSKLINVD